MIAGRKLRAKTGRAPWVRFGLGDVLVFIVLGLVLIATLFPFYNAVVLSFNDGRDALTGGIYFWPRAFTLANYEDVFQNATIGQAALVTVVRTVLGTVLTLLVTSLFSYAVSKKFLHFRRFYITLTLVAMYASGGLIPTFLLVRDVGLYNNPLVYLLPMAFSPFYAHVFIAYFRGLPESLNESAKIDGANDWIIYFRIILPLSTAVLAAIGLFVAVNHWNSWYDNLLYMKNPTFDTLSYQFIKMINSQNALEQLLSQGAGGSLEMARGMGKTSTSVQLATMVVTVTPIMMIYPFLQKYFVKGVMIGSIKG